MDLVSPRIRSLVIAALVLLLVLAAGCGRAQRGATSSADGYEVALVVEPAPPAVGDATLVFTVMDAAAIAVAGARVAVEGNMSHAGMVPVLGEALTGADGVARVPFRWTMAGDWVVTATIALPDGAITREFPLSVATR